MNKQQALPLAARNQPRRITKCTNAFEIQIQGPNYGSEKTTDVNLHDFDFLTCEVSITLTEPCVPADRLSALPSLVCDFERHCSQDGHLPRK